MPHHIRIARPVSNLALTQVMYCDGLGLQMMGSFADHDGFDGVMLGLAGAGCHFEFTHRRAKPVAPAPTKEDLIVLYIPGTAAWEAACARMLAAGFKRVTSLNPYWEVQGRTYEDHDGYRIVLQNDAWTEALSQGAV